MEQKLKQTIVLLLFLSFWGGVAQATDYTSDANCKVAHTMDIDESPIDDVTSNSNTAALKAAGEPDYTASGKFGGGYSFDNTDDVATITDFTMGNGDLSICFYFKVNNTFNTLTADSQALWGTYENANEMLVAVLAGTDNTQADGILYFKKEQAGGITPGTRTVYSASTTNSWTGGSWYHVAVTYDIDASSQWDVILYINGVAESTDTTTHGSAEGLDAIAANFLLGSAVVEQAGGATEFFDGVLDEHAIFNDVLTSTEINDIMDNGLKPASVLYSGEAFVFD